MTSRIWYDVRCDCGHTGKLCIEENDSPYSKSYEEYQLQGFNVINNDFRAVPHASFDEAMDKLQGSCPKCGTLMFEEHIQFLGDS